MKIDIKFKGLDEVIKKIDIIKGLTERAVEDAMVKSVVDVRDMTRPKIPYDTGQLERSWKINKMTKFGKGEITIEAGYYADYGAYQHEGQRED